MPARKQRPTLAVGMVGPDGTYREADTEIPAEWLDHPEFDLEHLVASGGAKRKKG